MIEKITQSLTNKIRKKMPEVDDERAEVINYGLQILSRQKFQKSLLCLELHIY